jgi:branched-chain amino acid transport system substrate-binding protein
MYQTPIRRLFVTAAFLAFSASAASAEQRGVTNGEIRIGQTMPYSGALSASVPSARRKSRTSTWSMIGAE